MNDIVIRKFEIPDHLVDRECLPNANGDFFKLIHKATSEAIKNGIEANSIIINENMVMIPETWIPVPGSAVQLPHMICGLHAHWTKDELPNNYSFAVFNGCSSTGDRLAQFESIGMEPIELKKAAELYRKVKDVLG